MHLLIKYESIKFREADRQLNFHANIFNLLKLKKF